MSGLDKALKARAMGVKNKVIGVVSDVLSAPARAYYGAKSAQAGRDATTLKVARQYPKNAASFDLKGNPTPALKARMAADEVRQRRGALR